MDAVTFEGQTVIVTGAGRGLGRAYSLELARLGASVVVNDVVAEYADEVVAEITSSGGAATASHESVATPETAARLTEAALDSFGRLDAVVNNAGILSSNLFEDLTIEQITQVLDTNLRSVFFVMQPAWRHMKSQQYGRVVITSSAGGMFARAGSSNYSASKAALYGLGKALSFEGAEHNIMVNMLLPRAATTISANDRIPGFSGYYPPALQEALSTRTSPASTAPLVTYLASSACNVTGEAFSSAYGRYARVFVGLADGWMAPDANAITEQDVIEHLDEIRDIAQFSVPASNFDEVGEIARKLGIEL